MAYTLQVKYLSISPCLGEFEFPEAKGKLESNQSSEEVLAERKEPYLIYEAITYGGEI